MMEKESPRKPGAVISRQAVSELLRRGVAGRSAASGKGLPALRTGLHDIAVASQAGIRRMASSVDGTVMHDLVVAAFGMHILGIVAAARSAAELGRHAGNRMMAGGALLVSINHKRREMRRKIGVAGGAVLTRMDIVVEQNRLLGQVHLDGPGGYVQELSSCGKSEGDGADYGSTERHQFIHGDLLI